MEDPGPASGSKGKKGPMPDGSSDPAEKTNIFCSAPGQAITAEKLAETAAITHSNGVLIYSRAQF